MISIEPPRPPLFPDNQAGHPGALPFRSSWCGPITVPSAKSPRPTEMRSSGKHAVNDEDIPTVSESLVGGGGGGGGGESSGECRSGWRELPVARHPPAVGRRRPSRIIRQADTPSTLLQCRRTTARLSLGAYRPAELGLVRTEPFNTSMVYSGGAGSAIIGGGRRMAGGRALWRTTAG